MQQMDTNNDGVISRAEWKGDPQVFDKIDRNNDGSLTREEAIAAARQHGGERLKQMDTNNDRQISRDEWKGSDEAFNRLDVNNDGVITREEIRALRRDQKPRG
jgi:Ca2+-binding EF-hand superfamily protein